MFKPLAKHIRYWFIYVLIATIFAVFTCEGAVRLLKLATPLRKQAGSRASDSCIPYKPQSFRKNHSITDEFDCYYEYNSLGFRDVEHTFLKPDGVFRILGLGDSFTEGGGVNFENSYLRRLEKMLNHREGIHPEVEIIKAGIGGYFPESERMLLDCYGVKFNPDLILVGFLPNDIIETFHGIDAKIVTEDGYLKTSEAKKLGEVGTWLYMHSHVCRIVLEKYIAYKMKGAMVWPEVWSRNEHFQEAWSKIEIEYKKMIELTSQINAEIVFIYIPQQTGSAKGWGLTYPRYRFYKWAEREKVHFIDIVPSMEQAFVHETLYHRKDGHCNAAGYRVIAETVYSELLKRRLVP